MPEKKPIAQLASMDKKHQVSTQPLLKTACFKTFLPAAKPTGHRTVRAVVGVVGGDYFEVMHGLLKDSTHSREDLRSRSTFLTSPFYLISHP